MDKRFIGDYITITTKEDGIFEGYVSAVDEKNKKLILEKVKDNTTNEKMRGPMHFYGTQIKNLSINKDVPKLNCVDIRQEFESMTVNDEEEKVKFKDTSDNAPALFNSNTHIDPELFLAGIESYQCNGSTRELSEPPSFVLINGIAKDFDESILFIQSQRVISVMAEGGTISRFGDITLLIIGTRTMVYIYDLSIHQIDFFENGLKGIFEDINILKVVHDVRMLSDCLYRVYSTNMRNVFDTQVAHAFIHKQMYERLPNDVASLPYCVEKYLNIDRKECSSEFLIKKKVKNNPMFWQERSFSRELYNACAKSAMFLRELRNVMLEKLLAEYLYGVNIYLQCVRNKSDNAVKYEANPHRYPKEFVNLNVFKGQRKMRHKNKRLDHLRKDGKETDSQTDSDDSNHRSEWDIGLEFSDLYKQRHGEIIECPTDGPPILNLKKPFLQSSPTSNKDFQNKKDQYVHPNQNIAKEQANERMKNDVAGFTSAPIENQFDDISKPAVPIMHFSTFSDLNIDNVIDSNPSASSEQSFSFQSEDFPAISNTSNQCEDILSTASSSDDGIYYSSAVNYEKKRGTSPKINKEFYDGNWSASTPNFHSDNSTNKVKKTESQNIAREGKGTRPVLGNAAIRLIERNLQSNNKISPHKKTASPLKPLQAASPPLKKTVGRGVLLMKQSEQSKIFISQKPVELPSPTIIGVGGSKVYEFPPDGELLNTPHVTKMISGKQLPGQEVNFVRKPCES